MKTVTKLWIGLCILALLSPLGLILPEHFKAGDAWGEWGTDTIKDLIGYVPAGLQKLSSFWSAPLPDYAFKGQEVPNLSHLSVEYIVSAFAGIALCVGAAFILGKLLTKNKMENE
jgi:cobalt/nickel transport protein